MPKKKVKRPLPKELLSTGEIADYCHTGINVVKRWIKKGDLEAFQYPGGHYRVSIEKFKEFLVINDMPIVEEFFQGSNKKKILIADDDAILAELIKNALEEYFEESEIEVAHDGYEALIKTGKFEPDILIIDIKMPRIDGLEACSRLRKGKTLSPGLKIIAMTAHPNEYSRDTVLRSGADDFLIKPFEITFLQERVKNLL